MSVPAAPLADDTPNAAVLGGEWGAPCGIGGIVHAVPRVGILRGEGGEVVGLGTG